MVDECWKWPVPVGNHVVVENVVVSTTSASVVWASEGIETAGMEVSVLDGSFSSSSLSVGETVVVDWPSIPAGTPVVTEEAVVSTSSASVEDPDSVA